jgi:hypothetical protein
VFLSMRKDRSLGTILKNVLLRSLYLLHPWNYPLL